MNDLSPLKRLLAETPPFFVKVQIISVIVLAIAAQLAKLGVIAPNVYLIITSAGAGIALVSQFAKKDVAVLTDAIEHPDTLLQHLPEILSQVQEIKAVVATPQAINMSLKEIQNRKAVLAKIIKEAKVVPMPTADASAGQPEPKE